MDEHRTGDQPFFQQRQRNSRPELSGTFARDGNSWRRVGESTQRRKNDGIPSKKQAPGTFPEPGTKWTSGDEAKVRDHIKGRFHEGAVVLATSTESMKKTDPENRPTNCRSPKVWMDGCAKDKMKTCRWMLHQTKTRQMTSHED